MKALISSVEKSDVGVATSRMLCLISECQSPPAEADLPNQSPRYSARPAKSLVSVSVLGLFKRLCPFYSALRSTGQMPTRYRAFLVIHMVLAEGFYPTQIIENIRHSLTYHQSLDQPLQNIAIESRASAIRVVFVCQAALCVLLLFTTMTLRDFNLL